MAHKAELFLQLSPEFGGTKFGPFQGTEVRLGSDPSHSDITLPEALGVLGQHVTVVKQSDESYVIAPAERTAAVFVWRADGRPPKQATTPVALAPGDAFSVVTPEGPRFILVSELPAAADKGPTDSFGKAKQNLKAASFFAEIKRQGMAKATTTTLGYYFRNLNTFIASGAIFSPRVIITGMMMIVPMALAGTTSCALCATQMKSSKKDVTIEKLDGDLAICRGDSGAEPDIPTITAQLLGDPEWRVTLANDDKLRTAYYQALKDVYDRSDRYSWVYSAGKKSNPVSEWYSSLSALPAPVARVLLYSAAHETNAEREWRLIKADSSAAKSCGRGPAAITYRQAKNLQFGAFQLDALGAPELADGADADKIAFLKTAAPRDLDPAYFDGQEILVERVGRQGEDACLAVAGADERTDMSSLRASLKKQLGDRGKGLPNPGDRNWVAARVMKFYAADFADYQELNFKDRTAPSSALVDPSPDQEAWVIDNTAMAMARAVAIPCMGQLDGTVTTPPPYMGGDFPSLVQCAILQALLRNAK